MIRPDGSAVLVDFGIARDGAHRSPTGEILGTPSYLAPERLQAGASSPERADLYALGVSLYESLTGQPAFVTPPELSPQQRAWRIIEMKRTHPRLDPGEGVPMDLRLLVNSLTEPKPTRRPASAAAAATLLGTAIAHGRAEQTVRISDPPGARRAAPILLLAAGLAVGAWLLRDQPGEPPAIPAAIGPAWSGLSLPEGDELRRTESVLLIGVPHGEVDPLADRIGAALLESGWRMTADRSSGGIVAEVYQRAGRNLGVLVSAEGPAAFVLLEDLDRIPEGESQIGGL